MSAADALQVFGSTIECRYPHPSGSGYVTGHFTYSGLHTAPLGIHSTSGFSYTGGTFLMYTSDFNSVSSSPDYITVDIQPTYSIFDTTQIHSAILMSNVGYVNLSAYDSPFWDWNYNGNSYHLEENGEEREGNNILGYVTSDGVNYNYVCCDFTSQNTTSGYSYRAGFSGVQPSSGYGFRLLIGLPYVSSGSTGTNGTFSVTSGGGSSGGDTNINVNIDMTETNEKIDETNGILGTINTWLSGFFSTLGNTVLSWFMPSQNFLSNWVDDIEDTLMEHFSPFPDLHEDIQDIVTNIAHTIGEGGIESVEFPAISVPMTDFSMPAYSVQLVPDAVSPLRNTVSNGIAMLCTIWVFNMVLNRIKGKILGEQVVEIEGDNVNDS